MAEQQGTEKKGKGRGSKKPVLIAAVIAVVAVIAVLIGVIVYLVGSRDGKKEKERDVVITQDNIEEAVEDFLETEPVEDPGQYSMSMRFDWVFPDGSSPATNAYVANVDSNTTDVYFDIVLVENEDEVIYESPILPVGSELTDVTLDKDLDPGVYDCVVIYHLVDEAQNTLSTVRVTLGITVEN